MAVCENCEKEFAHIGRSTARFCSRECRLEGMAKARAAKERAAKEKQCKYCGKKYKGEGAYCCPEHKRISEGIKSGSGKLYLQMVGAKR